MMGTGGFAMPVFRGLHDSPHSVVGLLTQPDRRGRGRHRHRIPLKDYALERGTPVFQPESVNTAEGRDALRSLNADLAVVAAYGQILSRDVIESPQMGSINVHASLLPKYRGAAPIQYAILHGERETGVTIFQIEPKLDAGRILGVVKTAIGPKETSGELEGRLAELAVPLTLDVVDRLEAGGVEPLAQESSLVTRAPSLRKSAGAIDWNWPAVQIARHVRAMQPWPTPFTFLHQPERPPLRVILTDVEPRLLDGASDVPPGTVALADQNTVVVGSGDGTAVEIVRLRPEGKRDMTAAEFQHGHALQRGDRFGAERPEPPSAGGDSIRY